MSIDRLILAARRLMYRHKAVLLPPSLRHSRDRHVDIAAERETFPQCCNLPSLSLSISRPLLQPRAQVKGNLKSPNAASWPGREHWNRLYSALKSERCAAPLRCAVFRADYDSPFRSRSYPSRCSLARPLGALARSLFQVWPPSPLAAALPSHD